MKRPLLALAAVSIALWSASEAAAAPTILSVQGTVSEGSVIRLNGQNFGTKAQAKPLVWADFENGLSPTSLGQKTSWDLIENMTPTSDGYGGGHGAIAADGSGTWTLRLDHDPWTQDGQRFYIYRRERLNFTITDASQNWKSWRLWPAGGRGYPNLYMAPNNGRVFVENIGTESGFWGSFRTPDTQWTTEEIIVQASSLGVKNGSLEFRQNGVTRTRGSIMTRSASAPAYMVSNYVVHGVQANPGRWNPGWSSGNRMWVDDVYVDTTWSRVMLGDAPTLANCRKLDIQIPESWTPSDISIVGHVNSFGSGARAYLYVFDADGNANANGYPITVNVAQQPVNKAPVVSAGPDQALPYSQGAMLQGQVSDDGLPSSPGKVTVQWSQVGGPAQSVFGSPNAIGTAVRFPQPGHYVLRLTASDGALSTSDDIAIDAKAVNTAPTVNAGADAQVTMPDPVTLSATVKDDGWPNPPGALTLSWRQVSGPATAKMLSPTQAATDVSFPQAGTYEFELTATDGELSSSDRVVVTVAPAPVNTAPVVKAGDASVTALSDALALTAQVTDDGLPKPARVICTWTKTSGPGTVSFETVDDTTSRAHFSAPGDYVVTVTANDGALSSQDTRAVTVTPDAPADQPIIAAVSGPFIQGGTVRIGGRGFGTKDPVPPLVWADFENGADPTSLGRIQRWSAVENMSWSGEGANGTKGLKSSTTNGIWTVRLDGDRLNDDGRRLYVFKRQRQNFLISNDSQNWKSWRMWPAGYGYPNIYAAPSNGRVYVENIGSESGFWGSFKTPSTDWTVSEIVFQASHFNQKDGLLVLRENGVDRTKGSVLTRSSAAPAYMSWNYVVHGVGSNLSSWKPGWADANAMWVDDVYVDDTWARVMLGDAPKLADCRHFDIEVPFGWQDDAIAVHVVTNALGSSGSAYLYVFDRDGRVNASGYPVNLAPPETPVANQDNNTGTNVRRDLARTVINPEKGERIDFDTPGDVTIEDRVGNVVRTLKVAANAAASWDGRNDFGSIVASGIYFVVTKAEDGRRWLDKVAVIK